MFNMDRSALNGALCQWQFYGKGNKLNTFPTTCVTSSVEYSSGKEKIALSRRSRVRILVKVTIFFSFFFFFSPGIVWFCFLIRKRGAINVKGR